MGNYLITPRVKWLHRIRCMARALWLIVCCTLCAQIGQAQVFPLAQAPLFTSKVAPGLVLLTMGRDLSFSKAAYNDLVDITGDGYIDRFFIPSFIYEGYFDSTRCYTYSRNMFVPASNAPTTKSYPAAPTVSFYACPGQWSGNFMNWLTMTRIDVLRKVLYGGLRSTDSTVASQGTVLERAYVPQDSTSWGKEYTSPSVDGYDISDFTPFSKPNTSTRHFFANTTFSSTSNPGYYIQPPAPPTLLVYTNQSARIWDLIGTDQPILGTIRYNGALNSSYIVRVKTCVAISGIYESFCTGYPKNNPKYYKPTGVLQRYGEAGILAFGLLTSTYDNNYSGGVLRSNIDDFSMEINLSDGTFNANVQGVIYHLNQLRAWGFGTPGTSNQWQWDCDAKFTVQQVNGNCQMWGNPLGEMMYEGLRYFSGAGSGSTAYTAGVGKDRTIDGLNPTNSAKLSPEPTGRLGLKQPAWANPYSAAPSGKTYPICSRPVQMVIGDPITSFDGDQLPGAGFALQSGRGSALNNTLGTLNVSTEVDTIWQGEFGSTAQLFFVGQAGNNADGNPTAKSATNFSTIRGHAPLGTQTEGTYYGAGVARYGKAVGVSNPKLASGTLKVNNISLALGSSIPTINIPVGSKTVKILPISKSVWGLGSSSKKGDYQPTGTITSYFIEEMANTNVTNSNPALNGGLPYYKLRINFSDTDQGGDNETDARSTYEIKVLTNNTLSIGISYQNSISGIEMHMGYVISGTTKDGLYLDIANIYGGTPPQVCYYLDTAPGQVPSANDPACSANGVTPAKLSTTTINSPRVFTVGNTSAGSFVPHDMLWYAAKYGAGTFGATGNLLSYEQQVNGDPNNYFLITNPSMLASALPQAFQQAATLSQVTTSAGSTEGSKVAGGSSIYFPTYDTRSWGGNVLALPIDSFGNIAAQPTWDAASAGPLPDSRKLILGRGGATSISITPSSWSTLTAAEQTNFGSQSVFQYLLGYRSAEKANGGPLRDRSSAIGDIVNSDVVYLGQADYGYSDATYVAFKSSTNPQAVAVGSNDGFFRIINAVNGVEKLAFMPKSVQSAIANLANPSYTHQYYVDGSPATGHVLNAGVWRSVVAGSTGAGGMGVFALNTGISSTDTPSVLWEYTSGDIGNVLNRPIVGNLESNVGAVLFGNGLNSATNQAVLVVLNALTGALIRTCTPSDTSNNGSNNGMTAIVPVSVNNNGKISYVYAADIKGNIWRIDPNDSGCNTNAQLVFKATSSINAAQPITGQIAAIPAPSSKTGYMVLFGTGKYAQNADVNDNSDQTLYGIWDDLSSTTVTRTQLVANTISMAATGSTTRTTTLSTTAWYDMAGKRGWLLDLACTNCPDGERHIGVPLLQSTTGATVITFLSYVPGSDPCVPSGGAWINTFNAATGNAVNAYANGTVNSVYVPSSTGRGLFTLPKNATASDPTTTSLMVSTSFTQQPTSNPPYGQWTGVRTATDGSGTAFMSLSQTFPSPATSRLHRQVWRQIQ